MKIGFKLFAKKMKGSCAFCCIGFNHTSHGKEVLFEEQNFGRNHEM